MTQSTVYNMSIKKSWYYEKIGLWMLWNVKAIKRSIKSVCIFFTFLIFLSIGTQGRADLVVADFTDGYAAYAPVASNGNYSIGSGTIVTPKSFSTLGISRLRVSQTSTSSSFEQGNDYQVNLTFYFSDPSKAPKTILASVNYRHGNTDMIGLILADPFTPPDDGLSFVIPSEATVSGTAGNAAVYAVQLSSTATYSVNVFDENVTGYNWANTNAASSSALGALNDYLSDISVSVTSVSSSSAVEGDSIEHAVNLSGTTYGPTTLTFNITDITTSGSDYSSVSATNGVIVDGSTLIVPSGVSSFSLLVSTINDSISESTEAYTLTVGTVNGSGSITDNDNNFTNWATPANVCTGSYNQAAYTPTNSSYFGVNLNDDGELTSIYDHTYNSSSGGAGTSFVSPFILSGGQPAYKTSAPVSMGSASALSTVNSSTNFYLSGPDTSGDGYSDVIVYSFKIPGDASTSVTVPYGDSGSHDQMLVAVQSASGTILASQFFAGDGVVVGTADHTGDLTFTMPSDGVAYLRYYVIDMGGGYGDVLDGGCAIYDATGPVITGPVGPTAGAGTTTGATSAISVNENQTAVTQVSATDNVTSAANITWTLSGDDAGKFAIATNGTITFNSAPDYEAPNDVGATANNNTYVVVITAEDEAGNTTSQTLTVTVLDVNEVAVDWVDWTIPTSYPKTGSRDTYADGAVGTVTNPANSATVNVTLTGEVMRTSTDVFASWNNSEASYGDGYNVDGGLYSPANEDIITQTGFTDPVDRSHTITFDQEVTGVVMGIWSLGGGQPSTLVFSEDYEIFDTETTGGMTRVKTSLGYELRGGLDGNDGSAGLIQFCGTFGPDRPLVYTVTDPEYYSGMNLALTTRSYTGGTCGSTITVDVTAPEIQGPSGEPGDSTSAIEVMAEQTQVTTFTAPNETGAVTWSKTGGAQQAAFTLNATTGVITFSTAPSYDATTPANNIYVVEVEARDATGNTSRQTLTVTVLPIPEYSYVDMCGYVNTNPVLGTGYPVATAGTGNTGTGIPFTTCAYTGSGGMGTLVLAGANTAPAGAPSTIEIDVPQVPGQNTFYALLNNYYGTLSANEYTVTVNYTDGTTQSFNSVGGTDTRDFNQNLATSNSIGANTTAWWTNYVAGQANYQRLDVRQFDISANSSKTLKSVTISQVHATDSAMITGLTFTTNTIGTLPDGDPDTTNEVTISASTSGAEANGGSVTNAVFTVSQSRTSAVPTIFAYNVSGTATADVDYTALSGSVTIPVGQTSATITAAILEDVLIEGPETIVVTLTGKTGGDATTQLSATTSNLTASVTIADDDNAAIIITNDDLNTTEGRDDPATMRFSLAGQPSGPVVLTFAGDAQCSVSPSTLTFDGTDFATPQTLRIQALNDEVVEGAHSCQPTVVVTSTDTRFNGLAVTLATVTVADDLVDQIRDPLTNILQSDFQQAVATHSRQFGQISKGALGRLQSEEDLRCGDIEALDVDGTAEAGQGALSTSGTINEDTFNCVTGVRRITKGNFAVNSSPSIDTQGIFTLTVQNEKIVNDTALRGFFYGGYLSSASLDGVATGNINGVGAHLGLYGANELSNGLFFDYYAAGALGRHEFDLSFYAPTAPIQVLGDYRYGALYAGAALSGEVEYDSVIFRPRAGFNLTYAEASDADVSATQLGITDTGRIELDTIGGTRIFAEAVWTFGEAPSSDEAEQGAMDQNMRTFEVAPRIYCTSGVTRDSRDCGYGGYISFNERNDLKGTDIAITFDYESNRERSEYLGLELSYSRDIFDGAGAMVTQFGSDHLGNAALSQSVSLDF